MGRDFNPFLLGATAGLGSALGSLTAYLLGTQAVPSPRARRSHALALRTMRRFGPPFIFLCNLIPILPMDFAGLIAGAVRFPVMKYLVYAGLANVLKMTGLIWGAATSLTWLEGLARAWAVPY